MCKFSQIFDIVKHMKIGIMVGSFKPFNSAHWNVVKFTAERCDVVHLYVSLADRKKKGEFPIRGSTMATIWREHIEPVLPSNVTVSYTTGSPVAMAYAELGEADKAGSADTYVVYAARSDMDNRFSERSLSKYAPKLFRAGQIEREVTQRTFSGTEMRRFLANGDKWSFVEHMPSEIDGEAVWDVLFNGP